MKRMLSALLALVMVITMLPLQAFGTGSSRQLLLGLLEPDDDYVLHHDGQFWGGFGRNIGDSVIVGLFEGDVDQNDEGSNVVPLS